MKSKGAGRPRPKLKRASATITRRVRRLIDLAHDGNVQAASRATGLPYPTIRDIYLGRSANPSLKTMTALTDTYRVFAEWFTDEKQSEEVPLGGWTAYLPALGGSTERRRLRQTVIPFAAWSMKSVAELLDTALDAIPPSSERPIIGDSRDEIEVNLKLSTFLLQSVLDAERAIGRGIAPSPMQVNSGNGPADEQWISRMRLLGQYWESVLAELIAAIQERE